MNEKSSLDAKLDSLAEAGLDGYDYARNSKLPRIPERWLSSPELRSVWITGYLTELRNRLEAK